MGCIVYTDHVYPAFVTLLADISCLLFLFRKGLFCILLLLFFVFSSLSPYVLSFFSFGSLVSSYPLLACLIRAAVLRLLVCICLHPDVMSSVVLISDLPYQSATIVFLDVGWVSEGLVKVSYG